MLEWGRGKGFAYASSYSYDLTYFTSSSMCLLVWIVLQGKGGGGGGGGGDGGGREGLHGLTMKQEMNEYLFCGFGVGMHLTRFFFSLYFHVYVVYVCISHRHDGQLTVCITLNSLEDSQLPTSVIDVGYM